MRQSQLLSKTLKNIPSDEASKNAQFLIRAGFIDKEMSGVYSFLPLGLRVLNKIERIIREEMDSIGGQEVRLTALQNPEVWKASKRWDDQVIDVWFKTRLKNGSELGLATTHEEPLTNLLKKFVSSHKDLPLYVYQFQTKFRNEIRAKSGIMRTREFVMKDLYSFCRDQEESDEFYEQAAAAYRRIFDKTGIGAQTFYTFASGGSFSKYSHEFQTVSSAGEDIIYISEEKKIAVNKEVLNNEVLNDLGLEKKDLRAEKSIEVGNIFKLGTKFSDALGLYYNTDKGEKKPVIMGCYGIGPARLMGTVVELKNDSKGIIWPEAIAPFLVHMVSINQDKEAEKLYKEFEQAGIEVLFDDREISPGVKFADADLIGIPLRLVVSEKTLKNNQVEFKKRDKEEVEMVDVDKILDFVRSFKA